MSWEVSFNRLAIQEYRVAREWYAKRSNQAVYRFIAAVDHAVNRIRGEAIHWQCFQANTGGFASENSHSRWCCLRKPSGEMRVVAVAHTSRRPRYWRRRE